VLLQCVAVCCSVLKCVAVWFQEDLMCCCSVLQCVAVYCSVLQCVAVWFEVHLSAYPASSFRVICVLSTLLQLPKWWRK